MAPQPLHLLDSFKRASEKPLYNSGKWELLEGSADTGEISGEAWKSRSAFGTENGAFWTAGELGGEVSVTLEYRGGLSSARYLRLLACVHFPTLEAKTGYAIKVLGEVTAGKVKLSIEKLIGGAYFPLKEKEKVAIAVGDRIAIEVRSGVITLWTKAGAGAWVAQLEHEDASYTQGYVGLVANGNLHTWRNFEANSVILSATQGQAATLAHSLSRTLKVTQKTKAEVILEGGTPEEPEVIGPPVIGQGRTGVVSRGIESSGGIAAGSGSVPGYGGIVKLPRQ